jgi:hypothetical protein
MAEGALLDDAPSSSIPSRQNASNASVIRDLVDPLEANNRNWKPALSHLHTAHQSCHR